MINPKRILCALTLVVCFCNLKAQNKNYECIATKKGTLFNDFRIYGRLIYQHQYFCHKAFSFQGIEAVAIINHRILVGAFGSLYISNLDVKTTNYAHLFINIEEASLFLGKMNNEMKVIHSGWQLNVGYFPLVGNEADFSLLHLQNPLFKTNGLVLSPQAFAEMNITRWMKFRTGLSLNFYSFEEQHVIKKSDQNNIALTFCLMVGKFN